TAQAVQFKLEGVPARLDPARSPLDPADRGPVYHVRTPRVSRPSFAGIVGAVECMLPHSFGVSSEGATHARVLQHMNAFNRDVRTLAEIPDAARKRSEPLVPRPVLATLPEPLRQENQAFERADALAQYYQRKTNAIINVFLGLALVSFFFFEVYAYYFPE